jgi:hypothetical protein
MLSPPLPFSPFELSIYRHRLGLRAGGLSRFNCAVLIFLEIDRDLSCLSLHTKIKLCFLGLKAIFIKLLEQEEYKSLQEAESATGGDHDHHQPQAATMIITNYTSSGAMCLLIKHYFRNKTLAS